MICGLLPGYQAYTALSLLCDGLPGTYGSQSRDDYSSDDVEQYFNYMGMLATEVSKGKLSSGISSPIASRLTEKASVSLGAAARWQFKA